MYTGKNLDIGKEMDKYKDEMLFHLTELLKIESVRSDALSGKPFGENIHRALDYMLKLSESFGLKTVNLDNYIGYTEYGEGEEYVCSFSHLDVVPAGEGWNYPPFGAVIENGRLYARGSGDNKPGNIAGLYTLRIMKEAGYIPKRKIRVLYGCAEETGMEDAIHYLQREPLPYFGFTADHEDFDLINAEKGRLEIVFSAKMPKGSPYIKIEGGLAPNVVCPEIKCILKKSALSYDELNALNNEICEDIIIEETKEELLLTIKGLSAHASTPWEGKNATALFAALNTRVFKERCDPMSLFINNKIGDSWDGMLLGIACADEITGALTFNMGMIKLEKEELILTADIRYPAERSGDAIAKLLENACENTEISLLSAEDSRGYSLPGHEMFERLRDAKATGFDEPMKISCSGGGTYSRKFKGRMVAWGGCGEKIHSPNESVGLDELFLHNKVFAEGLFRISQ
ncbi:MAG: Sapep family Mn(2+)-dependent dipeptidase [Firmicutes bacterium]|nr:Sapep family Mn(2+)-dependent dipeptidase [Bacillota bacterium]